MDPKVGSRNLFTVFRVDSGLVQGWKRVGPGWKQWVAYQLLLIPMKNYSRVG